MLRLLVVVLLLANAGFWAWRSGALAPLHGVIGARPEGEREPERLALQVRPERVRLIAPGDAAPPAAPPAPPPPAQAAASAPPAPPALACLEAGPYDSAALAAARELVLVLLPADGLETPAAGASWWIGLGPYGAAEQLRAKRDEIRRLGLAVETARIAPGAAPWLVLSRHASREAAEAELAALAGRGVRTAKLVDAQATLPRMLRVAEADAKQQLLLGALPTDKLGGRAFVRCADAVAR